METRASKKRANTIQQPPQVMVPKRQRVVLGEFSDLNLPDFDYQPTQKLQCRKNPNLKNSATTIPSLDSNLNKPVHTKINAKRDNQHIIQPYVSDISDYLRTMEMQKKRRPMVGYLENVQRGISSNMRGTLVDWLVEVADEYKLLPETLHLSVSYIDRFLSIEPVSRSKLQLLGVSSMLIASKYEEITPPKAVDFCQITDNTYDLEEVLKMEADILKSLNFEMGNPNVITFLKRFIGIACENRKNSNLQFEFLCSYLADLSLLDYECTRFLPSVVAASVIFLARFIIRPGAHPWTPSLCECLGYTSANLEDCVIILHDLYMSRKAGSFKAVRDKYKQNKLKCVANLPSSPEIPNHYFEKELCSTINFVNEVHC
ncbi:putative cyclin [Medicago truncatula]|uniref:B-like cyclin n=1 Tax=Medicago truncatula TaxID=3880 RepID=A0A072VC73_MEDTR|nr:putative cyclin-A3-1 [Medicago truncatula]KEH35765.1 carboxy-terminal domain cyclin [Medicago truncatula]RHN70333.1 putative cyclin [Medicago truncatula]